MQDAHSYDVIVIGAGSGGLTSAVGFSKIGKRVLLIEKEHMGGECTNSGCVPSKALLHHAKTYYSASTLSGETLKNEEYREGAFKYVRSKIDAILEEETPEVFREMGIDVVLGEAKFNDKCSVDVDGTIYTYKNAIIATGSSPRMIPVPGLTEEDVLTNQNIFALKDVPKRLLIVGAGPIGMEMGEAFSMLGSEVTIATKESVFAEREDRKIAEVLEEKFHALGIRTIYNAHITRAENNVAYFDIKSEHESQKEEAVPYDKVLVAVGRVPNLPEGLEKAGIEHGERCIMVNNNYRTSNKYVYAVGDVTQTLKFTHTADDIARQIVTRVASKNIFRVNRKKSVPKVTYTDPEVASVGLSYTEILKKYTEAEIIRIDVPYSANDRAKTDDATTGHMTIFAKRLSGMVLGASIVGKNAGDLISIFTIAIDRKVSMWNLRNIIYAYPTYSLLVKRAGDYFFTEQIGSLKADLIYLLKKHAPKLVALVFWGSLLLWFRDFRAEHAMSYTDMIAIMFNFFTGTTWGPFAYILIYAIRPLIFFPATLLTALSGALFGFWWGVIYTIIGENMSANFAYAIGRFFGKDLRLEDSFIGNWVEALRKRPFGAVLFMRLFYVPFDLTNYGSGVLKVKWPAYFLATVIGILPGLTTFVALGAGINDITNFTLSFDAFNYKFILLSVAIFVSSLILARFLKRWQPESK